MKKSKVLLLLAGQFQEDVTGGRKEIRLVFRCSFVGCVYVLQVSMAMVALLQDGVAFVGLSTLNVWCALLMLINSATSLLMENKNGRLLIN
jgi:hypothetical protein